MTQKIIALGFILLSLVACADGGDLGEVCTNSAGQAVKCGAPITVRQPVYLTAQPIPVQQLAPTAPTAAPVSRDVIVETAVPVVVIVTAAP